MPHTLINMAIKLWLTITLLVPGISGLVGGGDLGGGQQEYEATLSARQELVREVRELEELYGHIVADIDRVKRQGAEGLKGRLELESLLRQGRAVAEQLEGLQRGLQQLDGRLDTTRSRIVAQIDQQVRALEGRLARVSASERAEIVRELNVLRDQRRTYSSPMPAAPDLGRLQKSLEMFADLDAAHPAQMLAAADELEDTEDQLRRRLSAIEDKLGELRAAQQLARRAQSFAREESFFDESDRSRLIARYERVSRTPVAGNPAGEDSEAGEAPTAGGDRGGNNEAAAPPMSGDNAADEDVAQGAPEYGETDDFAGEPSAGFDGREDPGPPVVHDGFPEAAPGADNPPTSPGTPHFDERRERVVFESNVDPSAGVTGFEASGANLDRSIRSLEGERQRLQRQADELKSKADTLRKNARESLK